MKIVFLSHLDMNLYLFRLPVMQALAEKGHEVVALMPKGEYFDKFEQFGIQAVSYNIDRGSLNPLKEFKSIKEIANKLSLLQPNILHTFTLKPNIYGSIAAKTIGLKCVINSVTGLGSFYIDTRLKAKILKLVIENLLKIAFNIAKKVVFQNKDDLELYVNKRLLASNKAVLIKGSGVDTEYFSQDTVPKETILKYKQDLSITNSAVVVLMIARLIIHKGVREFCTVAENIKQKCANAVFILVGDVDKGNIASLNEDFLKPYKSVLWLGERKDILELIAMSDIFVLPSYREGIPRTLLEAGSMGKPIVTTNAVGCREVVDDGINGFLVPVGDTKILEEKIITLIQQPHLRDTLGIASRKKVLQEFSKETIVDLHLKLYSEVLEENI